MALSYSSPTHGDVTVVDLDHKNEIITIQVIPKHPEIVVPATDSPKNDKPTQQVVESSEPQQSDPGRFGDSIDSENPKPSSSNQSSHKLDKSDLKAEAEPVHKSNENAGSQKQPVNPLQKLWSHIKRRGGGKPIGATNQVVPIELLDKPTTDLEVKNVGDGSEISVPENAESQTDSSDNSPRPFHRQKGKGNNEPFSGVRQVEALGPVVQRNPFQLQDDFDYDETPKIKHRGLTKNIGTMDPETESELFDSSDDESPSSLHTVVLSPPPSPDESIKVRIATTPSTPSHETTETPIQRLERYMQAEVNKLTSEDDDGYFNWTLLQTWYNFAFLLCVVPNRLVFSIQHGKHILKSWLPHQAIFLIRCVPLVIITVEAVTRLWASFAQQITLLTILTSGDILMGVCTRICFLQHIFLGQASLMKAQDFFAELKTNYERPPLSPINKKVAISSMIGFSIYITLMLEIEVVTKVYEFHEDWKGEPSICLGAFALYGKQLLFQSDIDSTSYVTTLEELGMNDIMWGLFGLYAYASEIVTYQNIILEILSCCLSLVSAIRCITELTIPLKDKYNLAIEIKERISNLIGGLLLCFMADLSLSVPKFIIQMYEKDNVSSIVLNAVSVLVVLTPLLVGSTAALMIDQLKEKFAEEENLDELPIESRRRDAFIYKLSLKSTGIGYKGIFALNFATILGYGAGLGSVLLVIAEAISSLQTTAAHIANAT